MTRASITLRTTRAHVPGFPLNCGLDREPVAVLTCARLRWREHSGIRNAQTPPAIQSVAGHTPLGNVIAAGHLPGSVLRTAIDATRTLKHLAVRLFSLSEGHRRLICNLRGTIIQALRSLPNLPFVHCSPKPTNGISNRFFLAPALSSACFNHGKHHGSRRDGNVRIIIGEVRNVVR